MELYTIDISACKIDGSVDLAKAFDIHAMLQRAGEEPDKKLYGALMAVAGKAGRLDVAMEALEDFASEGIPITTTVVNALMWVTYGCQCVIDDIHWFASCIADP